MRVLGGARAPTRALPGHLPVSQQSAEGLLYAARTVRMRTVGAPAFVRHAELHSLEVPACGSQPRPERPSAITVAPLTGTTTAVTPSAQMSDFCSPSGETPGDA
jgi:hypothetical protein